MHPTLFRPDGRHFQLFFQALFLTYGLWFLHWPPAVGHYAISVFGCLLFTWLFESAKQKAWLPLAGPHGIQQWGLSVLISAASLCLLLKSGSAAVSLLAAFLTVASKYFFRIGAKHIFNPSAFGIIATIVLTQNAWLSPAQWGSNAVVFFSIVTLGIIVVTRVQKLDVSLAFLFTFGGLLFWRQVVVLGWPVDHFVHSLSTGSLLLFTFFMISDPRTSPNHPVARIVWAVAIGAVSFYLAAFQFMYNTPLWVMVVAAPLVPVLDVLFKRQAFRWQAASFSFGWMQKPIVRNAAAGVLMVAMLTHEAAAFCGFYVSKADGTLKNKTSQVIVVRISDAERDPDSLLHFFRRMLRAYRGRPELGRGELRVIDVGEPAVLVHTMSWRERTVLAVHSLSAEPLQVSIPADVVEPGTELVDLLTHEPTTVPDSGLVLDVGRYAHLWLGDT